MDDFSPSPGLQVEFSFSPLGDSSGGGTSSDSESDSGASLLPPESFILAIICHSDKCHDSRRRGRPKDGRTCSKSMFPPPPRPPRPPPPRPPRPAPPRPPPGPNPPASKSSSKAGPLLPSCSSSSTHLEKSVLMYGLLILSFVRRGQYSRSRSFLRRLRARERDVRRFPESYKMALNVRLSREI